ncbi:MAG: hypothetical protein ACKVWV_16210 [Planctomycetota bacterium]
MDFLLECVGFPPDYPLADIVARALRDGEPAAWRGTADRHRRLALGSGLELLLDRESEERDWSILPDYRVAHRLRVAVDEIRPLPDSPYDAWLLGWAAPRSAADDRHDGEASATPGAYRVSAFLTDARKLPRTLPSGHVLALSLACFALDVTYVGPDTRAPDARTADDGSGAFIRPLGAADDPGGCSDVSLHIREVRHLRNALTHESVDVLEADAPGRPLTLFVSRWQLERDGLPAPRAGWRIGGTFLFSGRIAGGLPGPRPRDPSAFG